MDVYYVGISIPNVSVLVQTKSKIYLHFTVLSCHFVFELLVYHRHKA